MGQAYMHDDDGALEAGRAAHTIITELKLNGISHQSIMLGFLAELHSLSEDLVYPVVGDESDEPQ